MASMLAEAQAKGVEIIVGVGNNLDTSEAALDLARRTPRIVPAVGIHPWQVTASDLESDARLRQLFGQKEVVAIGEVGIDLEKDPSSADLQWQVFRMQVRLAKELSLPLMVHCRGARDDMLDLLRKEVPVRGVLHGFSGTIADVTLWIELGFYIGIGVRTFTRNFNSEVEQAIRAIPLDRMLLETDSSANSLKSEGLQPTSVIAVAENVAGIHEVTPEEVALRTTSNLRTMLRLA
ncbi:MAG: TatD family hydrolase [Chloroflexi bacterium]|nr:TatD family hydrolase [Chloroflexota bacterium]